MCISPCYLNFQINTCTIDIVIEFPFRTHATGWDPRFPRGIQARFLTSTSYPKYAPLPNGSIYSKWKTTLCDVVTVVVVLCVPSTFQKVCFLFFLKWLDTLWQLLAPFNTIRFKFPGALQSSSDHHASYLGLLFGFTLGKVSSLSTLEGYGWNKIRSGWPNGSAVLELPPPPLLGSPAFTETCFMASWWRLESWLGGDTVNWYRL